jgi:hypothetical protein
MTISILTVMDSLKLKNKTMKQTAVEWLFDKLWDTPKDKFTWYAILEQAKEMEKQQIIDVFGVGCHLESKRLIGYHDVAEQHYNETYGSKGSDNSPKVENKDSFGEISSQTEISDEEIEEYAKQNAFQYYEFITGAKWYREQLKSRQ